MLWDFEEELNGTLQVNICSISQQNHCLMLTCCTHALNYWSNSCLFHCFKLNLMKARLWGRKVECLKSDSYPDISSLCFQEAQTERLSFLNFFCSVSELRAKEHSLLYGDFLLLSNSSSSLVYLRLWDQNDRYLAAFNWGLEEETVLKMNDAALPRHAVVALSTNSSAMPEGSSVDLMNLCLGPGQAALIKLPYNG